MQAIEEKLLRYLFSGKFKPGSRVIERDVAKVLGLSRIPVRETIAQLTAKGILVRGQKNFSVRIREYNPTEIRHLKELRNAIQIVAAQSACMHRTPAQIRSMTRICDRLEKEVGSEDSFKWIDLDREFHSAIVKASGNERFIKDFRHIIMEDHFALYLMPEIEGKRDRFSKRIIRNEKRVLRDHRALIKAIDKRDVRRAVLITRKELTFNLED
jgi:DNA-binding GntR family transcriptional regulator